MGSPGSFTVSVHEVVMVGKPGVRAAGDAGLTESPVRAPTAANAVRIGLQGRTHICLGRRVTVVLLLSCAEPRVPLEGVMTSPLDIPQPRFLDHQDHQRSRPQLARCLHLLWQEPSIPPVERRLSSTGHCAHCSHHGVEFGQHIVPDGKRTTV